MHYGPRQRGRIPLHPALLHVARTRACAAARLAQKRRIGLPMVDLMCSDLTFCQFFLRSDTRKLMPVNERRQDIRAASDEEG